MSRIGSKRTGLWLLAALLLAPAAAPAQGPRNLSVSLLGAVGGSIDENDAGYGNPGFHLGLATEIENAALLFIRVGALSFGSGDRLGALADPSFEYVTIGGEYRFAESIYDSGVYFALGGYRLEGRLGDRTEEETTIGAAVGVTGDFPVHRRVSLVAEISGHLLASDFAEFFVLAHGGIAIHL